MFLTSLDRASSRLYSRSGLASARSNKLAIVLPIDAIFSPPLQDLPGALSATKASQGGNRGEEGLWRGRTYGICGASSPASEVTTEPQN
jgi:hypothetical protein